MTSRALGSRALRSLLRLVYRNALPVTLRRAINLQRELARRELQPVLTDPPAKRRILVVAPHMDDEVFGCGGTLTRAAALGSEIRVVFISDGSQGYDPARVDLTPEALAVFEQQLSETRKAEAKRAGAILGYSEPVFLDLPDGRVAHAISGATQRLAQLIREVSPDVVFLPFFTDPHPDHWASNRLLIEAAAAGGLGPAVMCWGYEVWSPLVANTFVDVTAVMERKQQAMAVFESQTIDVDYPCVITALNAYRSLGAGVPRGYAEAFFVETLAEYGALFRKVWRRSAPGAGER